jgi:hypothetical protein
MLVGWFRVASSEACYPCMALRLFPVHKYFGHGSTVTISRSPPCSNFPIRNLQIIPPFNLGKHIYYWGISKELSVSITLVLNHLRFQNYWRNFSLFVRYEGLIRCSHMFENQCLTLSCTAFLENLIVTQKIKILYLSMHIHGSLPCSQQPVI